MKTLTHISRNFFITIVSATYTDGVIVVEYSNETTERYKGDGTVWHHLPLMARCSTSKEEILSSIQEYIKTYGNPYPTSHNTKTV